MSAKQNDELRVLAAGCDCGCGCECGCGCGGEACGSGRSDTPGRTSAASQRKRNTVAKPHRPIDRRGRSSAQRG